MIELEDRILDRALAGRERVPADEVERRYDASRGRCSSGWPPSAS